MTGHLTIPAPSGTETGAGRADRMAEGRLGGYARSADDWYIEPAWLVQGLVDRLPLPGRLWDPWCGWGMVPRILRLNGLQCRATDVAPRGYERAWRCHDFFRDAPPEGIDTIIGNPPFGDPDSGGRRRDWTRLAVERGMSIARHRVVIVQKLAWLEGGARFHWFRDLPPARVIIAASRASMPPGSEMVARLERDLWDTAQGGKVAYAWFVFEHGHRGPPAIDWIPPWDRRRQRFATGAGE
ncbi:hypothetical protein EV659_1184 [Rhodothalassium salexigens DSM 2132]|uniref:Methyltransferase family protein n=1 Tax=Rhodothalassium salexigens DSM 2132 TaxID=1188247 RepID=A0A4R2P6C2_RHOSA|nr:hypothetical protein [Rhodothalassium salexigens]MBB4212803.1 hypothetical protein [Rhodothalassium salexigens DSM 2132]MBK1638944.1 hypothetical protein [Rhodothalassium salexigens DSM 2132]TCP29694.1 hypothetical protein EV659_1184 [Rhodothalassium salexigens DSM 2132]